MSRRSGAPGGLGRRQVGISAWLRYVVGWLLAGGAVAVVVVALIPSDEELVSLPAVRETSLPTAAAKAGCRLRRGIGGAIGIMLDGGPGEPAPAGVYDHPVPARAAVAALRRGTIVIYYGSDLRGARLAEVRELQRAVPRGTIVAPNPRMRFALAAAAWRRLLACPDYTSASVDAVRLFRGRYLGSGPD